MNNLLSVVITVTATVLLLFLREFVLSVGEKYESKPMFKQIDGIQAPDLEPSPPARGEIVKRFAPPEDERVLRQKCAKHPLPPFERRRRVGSLAMVKRRTATAVEDLTRYTDHCLALLIVWRQIRRKRT